ncbi:MAG: class I SAM-dependent methyltransferase [Verrucomicrobiota bacterium]
MSEATCPTCGSKATRYRSPGGGRFILRKCADCALGYATPIPTGEELARFYQGFLFKPQSPQAIAEVAGDVASSLRHFLGEWKPGTTFLDYGGGTGAYAYVAQKERMASTLFDWDEKALAYAKEELGIERVCGDTEALADNRFDIIACIHMVEHSNDLDAMMRELKRLLAPGGQILFATPHAHSIEKWLRWRHFRIYYRLLRRSGESAFKSFLLVAKPQSILCLDPPRHLLAFTEEAFHSLASRHGFKARTEVGYNSNRLFDPRGYVLRGSFRHLPSRFLRKLARRHCEMWMYLFEWLFPKKGEQLYAVFTVEDQPQGSKT